MNFGRWLMAMADGDDLKPETWNLEPLTFALHQRLNESLFITALLPPPLGELEGTILFCQEFYFPLVKKSKNVICLPPPSQGWSDLNPKMTYIYLPTDAQQLINPLNFSRIFI